MTTNHAEKREAAIAYLISRNIHCFTTPLAVSIYRPVYGVPLAPVSQ